LSQRIEGKKETRKNTGMKEKGKRKTGEGREINKEGDKGEKLIE